MAKLEGEVRLDGDGKITRFRKKQRNGVPWKPVNIANRPGAFDFWREQVQEAYSEFLLTSDDKAEEAFREFEAAKKALYHALRDAMPKHEGLRLVPKYQPESLMCYYAPVKRPKAFKGRREMIEVADPPKKEAAE